MKRMIADYYIVRIYRKDAEADPPGLTGLVETEEGSQHPFHDAQELWRILRREPGDVAEKRRSGRNKA